MASQRKGKGSQTTGSARSGATTRERERAAEREKQMKLRVDRRVYDEIWAVILIALGIFFVLSLMTSMTGALGVAVQSVLFGCFGKVCSYIIALFLLVYGGIIFAGRASYITVRSIVSMLIMFLLISCISTPTDAIPPELGFPAIAKLYRSGSRGGGVVGTLLARFFLSFTGPAGLYLINSVGILIALMFLINTPLSAFFDRLKEKREEAKAFREERQGYIDAISAEKLEAQRAAAASEKRKSFDPGKIDESRIPPASSMLTSENWGSSPLTKETRIAGEAAPEPKLDMSPIHRFTPESIGLKRPAELIDEEARAEELRAEQYAAMTEGLADNQIKILEYVTDENLFSQGDAPAGYGLDGDSGGDRGGSVAKSADASEVLRTEGASSVKNGNIYKFPPLHLLKKAPGGRGSSGASISEQAARLNETLQSFKVNASVIDVIRGPAVTRFEVQPAAGVKVSSIVNLQDDIALNLRAKSIRIEAPIPGKAAVGIEVSNDSISTVALREIIDSPEFKNAESKISICLGKSIGGESIVADLKDMPHLLIAGATGSGKSVCISSIIMSILYKARPDEVKLILIDPKVVELSAYNGIPHLLVPVVTDPVEAASVLALAVKQMNERYVLFSGEGVRDLQSYNETVKAEGEHEKVLPQIVIIIDELADLIMAAQNAVEDSICRLAQKARGAGIHLIVATQRPSVDVITGVIKANIPSRIAFAVTSQVDSRTILDMGGAEKLLGKGDMLYYPQGMSKPIRVQGSFTSDREVREVIEYVKKNSKPPEYSEEVISAIKQGASEVARPSADPNDDELLPDAIDLVVRAEQASVSMLQRRFRIGYNRAARLVDMMEERGIVGPADGQRARKVNMTIEELEGLQAEMEGLGHEDEI